MKPILRQCNTLGFRQQPITVFIICMIRAFGILRIKDTVTDGDILVALLSGNGNNALASRVKRSVTSGLIYDR